MRRRTAFRTLLATLFATSFFALTVVAGTVPPTTDCTFTTSGKRMTLNGDCTTDTTIIIPQGFTLDGNGHTITAVDPPGDHFRGAVVKNGGSVANVTDLHITTNNLADACDADADRLFGIQLDGASGSITGNTVTNLNQGPSGCQEGNAIDIRNFGTSPNTVRVTIDGNTVTGYQKTGILVNGDVDATVSDNVVDGGGPVAYIARNGIQFGFGATGMLKGNLVKGNSYAGPSAVSGGILVVAGDAYFPGLPFCVGLQMVQNTLVNNDVGIYISQLNGDLSAPATKTNIKAVNNTISNGAKTNGYIYQAGVSAVGNNDKVINNKISGAGYNASDPCGCLFSVDTAGSTKAKVHANK